MLRQSTDHKGFRIEETALSRNKVRIIGSPTSIKETRGETLGEAADP